MYEEVLNDLKIAGNMAKNKIMEIYHSGFNVQIKEDNSPVTEADKSSDFIIRNYLAEHYPTYAILSEEAEDDKTRCLNPYCFIIDPLDGTKDFISKNNEFCMNLALSYKGEIVVGLIVVPAQNKMYYAIKGQGAYYEDNEGHITKLHVNDKTDNLTMYVSRFHTSKYEVALPDIDKRITKIEPVGSLLKAINIAAGLGEIHYRLIAGTKEWDIAPADVLVKEAGGVFIKPDGTDFKYNKEDVYNHDGYIMANRKDNIFSVEKILASVK